MTEKYDIRLLRFKSGEDIISIVEERKTSIKLIHPVTFSFDINTDDDSKQMFMDAWIPIYIMNNPEVTLKKSEFIWIMDESEISEEFIQTYLEYVGMDETEEDEFKTEVNVINIKDVKRRLH